MTDAPHNWVTIAHFFSPVEALFFKNVLEGHDIPAFVPNEFMGHLDIRLIRGGGGVQLKVPSDRVDEAKALLETPPDMDDVSEQDYDEEEDGEASD